MILHIMIGVFVILTSGSAAGWAFAKMQRTNTQSESR